ncbi:NADH-quinone oxidoreductase subunit NuoK [Cereibacter johrii]|uniref:NADH-quinone oxidoreductase subunit NuoK n=1 Tax=Cereibacter johrii TaxID=445629 RepID=UPI003CEA3DBA
MSATTLVLLLALAGGIFATGFFGLLARRAILFQLISLEMMLAGPALAFLAGGAFHGSQQGQAMFILIIILAAAEVALGLALYLALRRGADVEDSDTIAGLKH